MSLKNILEKTESIIDSLSFYIDTMEKARKIVDSPEQRKDKEDKEFKEKRYKAPVPTYYPPAKPIPSAEEGGIHPDMLDFHTTRVHVAPMGSPKSPHGHTSYSEHVVLDGGTPIASAYVHHAHPSDLGRATGKSGGVHDHMVDIHAPQLDEGVHPLIRQKVKDYVNSKAFQGMVDDFNKEKYGYTKPKWWLTQGDKPKVSDQASEGAPKKKAG